MTDIEFTTETTQSPRADVGRFFAEREAVNARLVRSLAANGAWNVIDAIYGDEATGMLCGSSPRLKAVA